MVGEEYDKNLPESGIFFFGIIFIDPEGLRINLTEIRGRPNLLVERPGARPPSAVCDTSLIPTGHIPVKCLTIKHQIGGLGIKVLNYTESGK